MTLMKKRKRRCDSRCYNAKGDHCTCICGGKNHGKGQVHYEPLSEPFLPQVGAQCDICGFWFDVQHVQYFQDRSSGGGDVNEIAICLECLEREESLKC